MELFDVHAHTNLSYCATEDLTPEVYRSALDDPNGILGRQALTNHGFQAYFPPDLAWSWRWLDKPELFDRYRERGDERLLGFRSQVEAMKDDRLLFGVEVELMADGRLTCSDVVFRQADILIGSLHMMPEAYQSGMSPTELIDAYLLYTRDLCASGVDVLGHPFRWLLETLGFVSPALITEVVSICASHGVAVELNVRAGSAGLTTLIREAVGAGVPLALATDAHSPGEVGRLEGHLEAIKKAGFDIAEVLLYEGRPAERDSGAEQRK